MDFVHVATRTKDPEAAVRFYQLLGMRETRRSELTKNKATLVFVEPPEGNFAIELVYNWGKDTPYDGGERFGHFAFHVDDLDGTYKRVIEGGGQEVGGRRRPYRARDHASPSWPTPTATGSS